MFLDAATQCGVAEGPTDGQPRLYTVNFAARDDAHVFARAQGWLARRLSQPPIPKAIWIEEPQRGRWDNATYRLVGLGAALSGTAVLFGVPAHFANVRTIRKYTLRRGDLPGDDAKRLAMRLARASGLEPANLDEADAWCGWTWARSLYQENDLVARARVG